jgi:tetratricopeptide (TPR) repeat protein
MKESSLENNPKLINKEKELRNFLEEIFKLDQSTPQRSNAEKCYERLLSKQDEFVESAVEDEYWNAVSLELFHMAQIEAHDENVGQARDYFQKALEAAKRGFSDEWLAYIAGTIHYLDNNQARLEQVMNRADGNIHVLQRLLEGLKKRGAPNYKEDY